MAIAEDELHLVRAAWTEMSTGFSNPTLHVGMAKKTPGTVVIDAKALYDALVNQTQPLQLAEKRGALELLAYARNTRESECMTRWVHSGANIADAMTKTTASAVMVEFMKTHQWTLVQDDKFMSEKKRKQKGLDRLDEHSGDGFFTLVDSRLREMIPHMDEEETDL